MNQSNNTENNINDKSNSLVEPGPPQDPRPDGATNITIIQQAPEVKLPRTCCGCRIHTCVLIWIVIILGFITVSIVISYNMLKKKTEDENSYVIEFKNVPNLNTKRSSAVQYEIVLNSDHDTIPRLDIIDATTPDPKVVAVTRPDPKVFDITIPTLKNISQLPSHTGPVLTDDQFCNLSKPIPYANCFSYTAGNYLYISFHGNTKEGNTTICRYSTNGCSRGSAIAKDPNHKIYSLRGMALMGSYLLVADADEQASAVLLFGACSAQLGSKSKRELVSVLATPEQPNAKKLVHPYALGIPNGSTSFYVSSQKTDVVLRFDREEADDPKKYRYNSIIADLKNRKLRGIAFDKNNNLYIATEDSGVFKLDSNGNLEHKWLSKSEMAVSLHYSEETNSLWVGAAGNDTLYEFDLATETLKKTIKHDELKHPTGIATLFDDLYVISRNKKKVLRFSTITGDLISTVIDEIPDYGEDLIFSNC